MLRRSLIAGFLALLALPLAAQQQDNSAPPPAQNPPAQTNPPAPAKKDAPKKSTTDQNPFPEAQSQAAAHEAQQQDNSDPSAPQPQTTPQNRKPASDNPFPEAQSQEAARDAQHPDGANPSAPPPADDQSFSSSQVKGLDMPTTDVAPPANLPPSMLPYNPKLARKDAEIGDFYMESGNWQGAYERFLEANRSDPGNAEAVFGLADTARRLHHPDEALRNYRLYLSALPNGPHAKEVRKALKEMGMAPPG
ncbi:MAG TPA: tetratricopeptide repeat protein [Acidobacteriaceae bacterium]|jgi:tetratricopeptide (TPR) repeat protein